MFSWRACIKLWWKRIRRTPLREGISSHSVQWQSGHKKKRDVRNQCLLSFEKMKNFIGISQIICTLSGFSFEAGGWKFRPVVFHSMSGTLISIFEGFFIIIILFIMSRTGPSRTCPLLYKTVENPALFQFKWNANFPSLIPLDSQAWKTTIALFYSVILWHMQRVFKTLFGKI